MIGLSVLVGLVIGLAVGILVGGTLLSKMRRQDKRGEAVPLPADIDRVFDTKPISDLFEKMARRAAGESFPTHAEAAAAYQKAHASVPCHDARCPGYKKHPCHDLNCKDHKRKNA